MAVTKRALLFLIINRSLRKTDWLKLCRGTRILANLSFFFACISTCAAGRRHFLKPNFVIQALKLVGKFAVVNSYGLHDWIDLLPAFFHTMIYEKLWLATALNLATNWWINIWFLIAALVNIAHNSKFSSVDAGIVRWPVFLLLLSFQKKLVKHSTCTGLTNLRWDFFNQERCP